MCGCFLSDQRERPNCGRRTELIGGLAAAERSVVEFVELSLRAAKASGFVHRIGTTERVTLSWALPELWGTCPKWGEHEMRRR